MNLSKKRQTLLISIIILTLIILSLSIIIIININKDFAFYMLIPLFISIIILFKINTNFKLVTNDYKYSLLQAGKSKSIETKTTIMNENWEKTLEDTYNYQTYLSHEDYKILYRFDKGNTKSQILFIIVIIKNDYIQFESINIATDLSKLEHFVGKTNKYKHRIILQFKKGHINDPQAIESCEKVFFFQQVNINFVLINVLYEEAIAHIYYLHNENYSPTTYYNYGITEINKIT